MDTNETQSIFEGINDHDAVRRKDMIPKWIRFFCWFFAILGSVATLANILKLVSPMNVWAGIYGFNTNQGLYPYIIVSGVYLLKMLTAIGLLSEKDWAVKLAIADGIVGLVLCVYCVVITFAHGGFPLLPEVFVLTPYLVIMLNIRKDWEENRFALQQTTSVA